MDIDLKSCLRAARASLQLQEFLIAIASSTWLPKAVAKPILPPGLGVSVKTLNAWAATYDDFREAMSQAKELEYAWWLAVGRKCQFTRSWNSSAWALQMNGFRKRFHDRVPAQDKTPEESVNAEQLRAEMERKLSRIADAGAEARFLAELTPGELKSLRYDSGFPAAARAARANGKLAHLVDPGGPRRGQDAKRRGMDTGLRLRVDASDRRQL